MKTMHWGRRPIAAGWICVLLAGCNGGGGSDEPAPPPDPLPPAGTSRWATLERDEGADGSVEQLVRYSYDTQGRRSAARTFAVADGVVADAPTHERLWSFDRWSRIVGTVDRYSSGTVVTTTHVYGADGRLASQRAAYEWGSIDTQFVRRDGRIVEVRSVQSGRTEVAVTRLTYGSDGRVATAVADPGGAEFDARYAWRPDGRPAAMGIYTGFLASYGYQYDAGGRHVSTSYNDDGIYFERAELAHDAPGRLLRVDRGQAPEEGSPFVPTVRSHYRWEAAPCQPLAVPGEPPSIEDAMAGLVSADNVTFGCAP